jgi:hypothetical protein
VRRIGMICKHPTDVCMRNLRQKAEQETGTNSCTRFLQVSCFKKNASCVTEIWGRMYNVILGKPKV